MATFDWVSGYCTPSKLMPKWHFFVSSSNRAALCTTVSQRTVQAPNRTYRAPNSELLMILSQHKIFPHFMQMRAKTICGFPS